MTDALEGQSSHDEQELAEALQVGLVMLTAAGHLVWWNEAAGKLLGFKPQHKGKAILKLLKGAGIRTLFSNHIETLAITRILGRKTWHLSLALRPYRDGNQLLIVRDTTDLEQFISMRKDFIANVSHELRTPLTVFRGYIELMSDQHDITREEKHMMLQQMGDQCERMEVLVRDLLLLSRLEGNVVDTDSHVEFAVAPLLEAIIADAKQLSGHCHTFEVSLDAALMLRGSATEIRSAFSNLIYNAVRYTPAGGLIRISWRKDAGYACFSVVDTGVGISDKHIDKITQRFYRVDPARTRVRGGTGLGLAIVKHVLMRHDATLQIKSALGQGSTFSCLFPISQAID